MDSSINNSGTISYQYKNNEIELNCTLNLILISILHNRLKQSLKQSLCSKIYFFSVRDSSTNSQKQACTQTRTYTLTQIYSP